MNARLQSSAGLCGHEGMGAQVCILRRSCKKAKQGLQESGWEGSS